MALESLFARQQSDRRLPYAGKPFYDIVNYTYHLRSLISMSYLYRFPGDQNWLTEHWNQYVRGVEWALSSVDKTGLANVTASADWLRFGMGGHIIEAMPSSILCKMRRLWPTSSIDLHNNQMKPGYIAITRPPPSARRMTIPRRSKPTGPHPQTRASPSRRLFNLYVHRCRMVHNARISPVGPQSGPTSALSTYAAGIQLTGRAGEEWRIASQRGHLTGIDAGLSPLKGQVAVRFQRKNKKYETLSVRTPIIHTGDSSIEESAYLPGQWRRRWLIWGKLDAETPNQQ